ncbi:uncharacterized protein BDR25DRAFT_355367, partial [Lindgomyces ingoldianus]
AACEPPTRVVLNVRSSSARSHACALASGFGLPVTASASLRDNSVPLPKRALGPKPASKHRSRLDLTESTISSAGEQPEGG